MNQNKVIEIEGELDEDDFNEISNQSIKNQPNEKKHSTENLEPDYEKISTIEQMINSLKKFYEQELNSALKSCESLSKDQIKSFDILEKFQSEFYSKEMIEIQETFGLVPQYLKKISGIKDKMKEIEKKMAIIKNKKSQKKN